MTLRRYANLAAPQTLVSDISDTATSIEVGSTSLFPAVPFLLGIDRGTPSEEVMLCTAKTSTTFTVTRGYDGTTALSHTAGALVEHTVAAVDFREAGIRRITTAERDGLAGEDLWVGRVIYNTDSSKLQVRIGSAWINVGPRTGAIEAYGGDSDPQGALICDGRAVSRTTYADLYAVVGTTFGAGDGSTTFNLPDLRQRFPLGKAASGTGDTLGETGGAIDHVHAAPAHTHTNPNTGSSGSHAHSQGSTGSGGSHAHSIPNTGVAGDHKHSRGTITPTTWTVSGSPLYDMDEAGDHSHSVPNANANGTHTHNLSSTNTNGSHTHSQGSTGSAGGGNTGSANPPYQVVNFIIYV